MQTYRGACHCGRITFELDARLEHVVECNCSICRMKGALWHAAADSQLRILSGADDLALYQFNTRTAKHYFCNNCGVSPFSRPRLDPRRWVVNVRCIEGVELAKLPIRYFDGEHWEEAAKALLAKQHTRTA